MFFASAIPTGGTATSRLGAIVADVRSKFSGQIGIHAHNDCDVAVANTLAAVENGVTHVQGCLNGYGERCGNANLASVIANLELKAGKQTIGDDMNVELTLEGRPIDIVAEGFDAGIRLAESVPQDMVAIPCGPDTRFIVVGAPDYFARASVPRSPSDLLSHECIRRRMAGGKLYRWEFEKRGEEMAVDVPGRLTLDNDSLMVEAAVEGLGLAFVSDFWVTGHLATGALQAVLEDWTPPFPGLRLYYPVHRHMTAGLRAFVDMLREERKSAAKGKAATRLPARQSAGHRKRT